jgi:polyisoprenoid-binding protein YceI
VTPVTRPLFGRRRRSRADQGSPPPDAVAQPPIPPAPPAPPIPPIPPIPPAPPVPPAVTVEAAVPAPARTPPHRDGSPSVRGAVTTVDGWPLPGATVTLVGPGGRQLGRALVDETGAFEVAIRVAGAGAVTGEITVILAATGVDPIARTITLGARGTNDLGVIVLHSTRRATPPAPGRWTIDPAHSIVRATARHLALSRVEGRFTAFSGEIHIRDPIEQSSVEVTIDAASIDTGNADRDAHLRSADFLDVERFPVLTFHSRQLTHGSGQRWRLDGVLTIRDIAREAVLDVAYLGAGPDPWGGSRIAFVAMTQLARHNYEMNWNMGMPGGLVVVGPTLRVDIDVQAFRQP